MEKNNMNKEPEILIRNIFNWLKNAGEKNDFLL